MAKVDTLTVELLPEVSERTARMAVALLDMFLHLHPEYNLRVLDMPDGDTYRLVKADEPCFP